MTHNPLFTIMTQTKSTSPLEYRLGSQVYMSEPKLLSFFFKAALASSFPTSVKRNHNYPIVHAYLFPFLLTWYVIYQHILTFLSRYLSESDLISLWIITKTLAKTTVIFHLDYSNHYLTSFLVSALTFLVSSPPQ